MPNLTLTLIASTTDVTNVIVATAVRRYVMIKNVKGTIDEADLAVARARLNVTTDILQAAARHPLQSEWSR